MALIVPFSLILISAGFASIYRRIQRNALQIFVITPVCLIFICSLFIVFQDIQGMKSNPRSVFDSGSNDLFFEVMNASANRVVCVDWGVATIIHGLSQGKLNILDYWGIFNDKPTLQKNRQIINSYLDRNILFIVSAHNRETFPQLEVISLIL
jgi:hypothetical protein